MNEFEKILEKMKMILGVETEAEVATAIGMKPSAFSNRKKSGSIPFSHYIEKANSLNVNLNWLIQDEGSVYKNEEVENSDGKRIKHIDPAVKILHEVMEETGVKFNEKQKQACLKILREELEKSDSKAKEDLKKYIKAFGE